MIDTDPLIGKLVRLDSLRKEDLGILRRWRNRWDIRSETREFRLLTLENQEAWWKSLTDRTLMFGIYPLSGSQNLLVGVCGLTYIDWKNGHTELSCYIGEEDQRRRGFYTDSVRVLTRYAFEELRLHMVYGEIYEWNEAALNACKRMGFYVEGPIRNRVFRFGDWFGSYFVSKTENEWMAQERSRE